MENIRWVNYEETYYEQYKIFADCEYGKDCYQGTENYLRWLYYENQCSRGYEDLLVGILDDGRIIGFIHKMRLPWNINGEITNFPSLHNLVVQKEFRSGAGFWLLKKSIYGEAHALIPGVVQPLSSAYSEMKCQQIQSKWFRQVLSPFMVGLALCYYKLTGKYLFNKKFVLSERLNSNNYSVTGSPEIDDLEKIAFYLNNTSGNDHVVWDTELVRWRFFSKLGPKHIYIKFTKYVDAFSIVSLGQRSGFNIARIIVASDQLFQADGVLMLLQKIMRKIGVTVLFFMTTKRQLINSAEKHGFSNYKIPPDTYIFHKDKSTKLNTEFGSEITDVGFESIISEIVNE